MIWGVSAAWSSPPRRARRTSLVLLAAVFALPALASAATPTSTTISGYVADLTVANDGSLQLATVDAVYRQPLSADAWRLGADLKTITRRDRLVGASRRHGWADVALTPGGAVAGYSYSRGKRSEIRAVISTAGQRSRAQRLSDPRNGARGIAVAASPSGAAAVVFMQGRGRGRWQDMVAVRAAGAATFAKPVAISRVRSPGFASDIADSIQLRFGRNGTGVIVQAPLGEAGSLRLRRIAPSGAVSRGYTVAKGPYEMGAADAAVGDDGTIVVAFRGLGSYDFDGLQLLSATFPPTATAPTPPVTLGFGSSPNADDPDLGLVFGPDSQALLISGENREPLLNVFEGPAAAPQRTGKIPAEEHDQLTVAASGDGGVSAFWVPWSSDRPGGEGVLMTSHRPPGGQWSPASPVITKPGPERPEIGAVVADPGRGVIVALQESTKNGMGREVALVRAP